MTTAEYWAKRARADMDAIQDAATVRVERIGRAARMAAEELTAQVEKIIGRYAKRFGLTREEAEAVLRAPFDEDSRAYGYRMTRAEALREAAQEQAKRLAELEIKEVSAQRKDAALESYRRAGDRVAGYADSFSTPDTDGLMRAVGTRWAENSYSQSIWSNAQTLAETLGKEVTAAFLSGKSNAAISQKIAERFGVEFRQAERLVRTETSYVCNRAALVRYEEAGLEEYEFLSAHDGSTCKLCGGLDRKRFPLSEQEAGVNAPPMHPWCRCTVLPVVAGMDDNSPLYGRGEYGEDVLLPGDMNYREYREWAKAGYPKDVEGWRKSRKET